MNEIIRRQLFVPYAPGQGPQFLLTLMDIDQAANPLKRYGKHMLGYKLEQVTGLSEDWTEEELTDPTVERLIFAGVDFGVPPTYAIDGDDAVHALMSFLCLKPGDVPQEHFDAYTPYQQEFADLHAEVLQAEADTWHDLQIRAEVERDLHAAGIIEDPDMDGGLLG